MARWMTSVIAACAVVVGACSTTTPAATTTSTSTTSGIASSSAATTTTLPTALEQVTDAPSLEVDRLVVLSLDGEVMSMDRTGADRLIHSEAGEVPMQPIWDAAGERISYALIGPTTALVVAAADGTGRNVAELPTNPFYLYWSHDGQRLASLRNSVSGLAFEIFDVSGAAPALEFSDVGSPYYFDWSPRGADLVAHVGTDRLDVWEGSDYQPAGPEPGFFSAPQWLEDGFLAPVNDRGRQQLALIGSDGSVTPVADFDGSALFEVESSAQRLLAIQALSATADADAVEAAFQLEEPLPPNELVVVDLSSDAVETVSDRPVLAFFWSPFGERLLFLTPSDRAGALQWHVWEEGVVIAGPEFAPFRQWFAEFIPFFEQYSRSMSLWAPDGSAYAFPGGIGDEQGVWVVEIDSTEPTLIAPGIWVSWSQN